MEITLHVSPTGSIRVTCAEPAFNKTISTIELLERTIQEVIDLEFELDEKSLEAEEDDEEADEKYEEKIAERKRER